MNKLETITIVGGGTAGLVSALILKNRFLNLKIKVIKSDKIGIIGVGEGSTEHFAQFMDFCGITESDLIRECDSTIKWGVMFEGWTPKKYFHNVLRLHTEGLKIGQYSLGYAHQKVKGEEQLETTDQKHIDNTIFKSDLENGLNVTSQYHFNTFKLNEFLIKKAKLQNIEIINDEIIDVKINNEKIEKIIGEKESYKSDFFIDCTGLKRLLISKLGAKWKSYAEHLTMNEAIAFQTEDTDNYNTYTLAKAMNYGWLWRIPVYGRWGNGYVFNNNYINANQAQKEVEKLLGKKIKVAKNIKFDPGRLDKVWIGNCLAVGLSANFVEPLEATSIGTTIQQTFLFMHLLANYNEKDIDTYNKKVESIMTNIRDFIFLHYMVDKDNSNFWKNIRKIKPPNSLKEKLDIWKRRLPIEEDFLDTRYLLFFPHNWISVLYGLGMIDNDNIKNEYNMLNDNLHFLAESLLTNRRLIDKKERISHKDFLTLKRKI